MYNPSPYDTLQGLPFSKGGYTIVGKVIHGEKRGRTIGFPTINIPYSGSLDDGTYAVNIEYSNISYKGVGVYLQSKSLFEAHIFDFDTEIYEKHVSIYIVGKLRENKKFDTIEALKTQIQKDVFTRKNTQYNVLTFGSFDHVHQGHKYYLSEAKKYGDTLITIIASDINIQKIKGNPPKYSQIQRQNLVKNLSVADEVILGSAENPLKWIEQYKPSNICLGYDQKGPFIEKLSGEITRLGLNTQIVRIDPHYPEKYKSSLLKNKSLQL